MTIPKRSYINPRTGDRYYRGVTAKDRYLSVTTLLGGIPKQHQLTPWAAKVAASTAADIISWAGNGREQTYFHVERDDDTVEWIEWDDKEGFIEHCARAYTQDNHTNSSLGDNVHAALEIILGESGGNAEIARHQYDLLVDSGFFVDEDAQSRCEHVLTWLEDNDVEVEIVEFTIYNDTYKYAGSCDFAAKVNGVPYLIDIKTGQLKSEAALQLSAYKFGEFTMGDDRDDKLPMPFSNDEAVHCAVLHTLKTKCKLVEVDASGELFECFIDIANVKRHWVLDFDKKAIKGVVYDSKKGAAK